MTFDLSKIDEELRICERAKSARPWELHNSCSWRRIGQVNGRDGGVLCPTNDRHDRHPDLDVDERDMRLIIHAANNYEPLLRLVKELRDGASAAWRDWDSREDGAFICHACDLLGIDTTEDGR